MARMKGSGLGARMPARPADPVAAGLAAATGDTLPGIVMPEAPSEPKGDKADVVALNIRLPKELHRTLRRIAFDGETSINALLIEAAEKMLADRK